MNIFLPGQYPRSENLVAATREYDRRRISADEMQAALQDDVSALKAIQWGFPYQSTGLFNWQDLLRPFAELIENSQAESLKRFYETNTFWRILEAPAKVIFRDRKLDEWFNTYFLAQGAFQKDDPVIINLPFPFLFREYSKNLSFDQIDSVFELTFRQIKECPNAVICLVDPSFGWKPLSNADKEYGTKFVEKLRKTVPNTVFLLTFFFPLGNELDYIYELPVDGYGIDFYNNSLANVLKKFPVNKTLLAGVLNTESTLIESSKNISQFMEMIQGQIPVQQIYLSPNGPSELLPREIMNKKVKNLQEVITCLPHPS